tara:strand:- start:4018 stop:4719 length:702 start_codon:yes stop_codon:yes gene_type:complete
MKIAIMQPYFMPYIGYFQLINAVDKFVIYDNIKYTKKGWINRNRILVNGKPEYISLPIKKNSDFLNINERVLSDSWKNERRKLLNKLKASYAKSPFYSSVVILLEDILNHSEINLFNFIFNSIQKVCHYLDIETPLVKSSSLDIDCSLKGALKVIKICNCLKSNSYVNPIGGINLYNKNEFLRSYIHLTFLKSDEIIYNQSLDCFLPFLSIIDILMFNSKPNIKVFLNKYSII